MEKNYDILIIGSGAAGLYCALNLPDTWNILMITKDAADQSDSFLAQGGICVLKDDDDYHNYFEDTLKAGHYQNNRTAVDLMIRKSPEIIDDLIEFGVEFEKKDGAFQYTKEAAHSTARILFHKDITGQEITSRLLDQVRKKKNIILREHTTMIDLVCYQNTCTGIVVYNSDGTIEQIHGNSIILATGGLGGLYANSTNFPHITGDAIALALKHKIQLQNLPYVQIHPTALYTKKNDRRFLISESVRGEGAHLYNARMERFVDELLPRDLLTKAILQQMQLDKTPHVWLSMKHLGAEPIAEHFPNIHGRCLCEGYDVTKECIPVVPAQHYHMGGIQVNTNGETSAKRLYAIGEASCNGVHGANRLASNSLLDVLVFAKQAANHITQHLTAYSHPRPPINLDQYAEIGPLKLAYKEAVLDAIQRR